MVAASVRMAEFCPLFFMPSLCFPTWFLPAPFGLPRLPVNLGPFLLLLITKLILPQSSLTGHLAGILAGFPLAWGLLDWLTPPVMGALLVLAFLLLEDLWVWRLPGYARSRESAAALEFGGVGASGGDAVLLEFVPAPALTVFQHMRLAACALTAWTLLVLPLALAAPSPPASLWALLLLPGLWLQMAPHLLVLGAHHHCRETELRTCGYLTFDESANIARAHVCRGRVSCAQAWCACLWRQGGASGSRRRGARSRSAPPFSVSALQCFFVHDSECSISHLE
jgi:hypothetical protein